MQDRYEAILTEAHAAASAAIQAKYDAGDREQPFNCGFAWVKMPARSAFARYLASVECGPQTPKALAEGMTNSARYGRKGEPGWQWWKPGQWPNPPAGVPSYQQDMDFHIAGAEAFASVLNRYGMDATVGSRLD
jgi:hypothetical protein